MSADNTITPNPSVKKTRYWTVVFMIGNVPRVVRRYKSLKNAYEAMSLYEQEEDSYNDTKRAWIVKTDNRSTHKKKPAPTIDINDPSTLPTVYEVAASNFETPQE